MIMHHSIANQRSRNQKQCISACAINIITQVLILLACFVIQAIPRRMTENTIKGNSTFENGINFGKTCVDSFKLQYLIQLYTSQSGSYGGAFYSQLESGSKLTICGSCSFTDCKALGSQGGAIYVIIDGTNSQLTFEDSISFERCSSDYGGGMFLNFQIYGQIVMAGSWLFKDCTSTLLGGGCYIYATGSTTDIQLLGNMQFQGCNSSEGGGLVIKCQLYGQITINQMSFTNCNSNAGGGFITQLQSGTQMTITGKISFDNCRCQTGYGGGQYLLIEDSTIQINITGELEFKQCSAQFGGGLIAQVSSNAIFEINKASFKNCSSNRGGGIFIYIRTGGQLILDNSCYFYQCQSRGNGGGIYINISFTNKSSFLFKDVLIHECKSITNNSLSYPESGFGGGIFISGSGNYYSSTKLIDLHGMKIYNNSADKFGQSAYVVMSNITDLCKYGIAGEYVKGNYSDTYSNEHDLEGIPMNTSTFNTSTSSQILRHQKPLILYWLLGILKNAQVIVNVSNLNGKLMFQIEGQRMIRGYLNVKIFELRDKTQEEIDQDLEEMKQQYNKNNFKPNKQNSTPSPISQKHQSVNHQQIFINSNLKIQKNLRNYANEIIYPSEDGSSSPILIEEQIESEQKASFGMNEYKLLNYKQKWYAILISNDRNIFTGKDGKTLEEDYDAAVQLEVIIQEEDVDDQDKDKEDPEKEEEQEEQGKGLPIGIIVGIAVGALAIAAVIIIIIIVAVFVSKKKKSTKPARSYGPEMRARDLPMENKFPQNSHTLDAVNKMMEKNNW
ncbi:MAG: hypothetical protein EZS28_003959 [Streblomastix strix]|uniref:Right handed beta helix domain-containing protein n=1 Tax=Streblomastix strix TaxID=222440 RepID=A0A5J4X1K6_9EUKA|nr:MAG: hypothetical protein EZS28_003959 [Streblomastix strix]